MKIVLAIAFLTISLSLCPSAFAQVAQDRGIWKATPLSYPPVAWGAQIQGDVRLDLEIDKTGRIISVTKLSGPDPLAVTASEEIKKWHYTSGAQDWHAALIVHYSLRGPRLPTRPVPELDIRTPFDIDVISNYPLPTGNPKP